MPSREERRARRRARRAKRKENRKLKRDALDKLMAALKDADFKFDVDTDDPKFVDAFNEIWPVLEPSLEYAKAIRLTGPKADKIIQTMIEIGYRISKGEATENEEARFIGYLDAIWDILEKVLGILKSFTPDNVDKVIDHVLEVGDWITDNEDDDDVG